MVHVGSGRLLDVFEGREAQHLRAWIARMPTAWLSMIKEVSVDPHEGYRGAVLNTDSATGRPSPLAGVAIVVDPFHVVRLASDALTRCRHRVQQETLEDGRATRSMTRASSCSPAPSASTRQAGCHPRRRRRR
ncbi:MAG TPA: transposase [Acidimicrobiales bacterium]|nr:transposase [Acidimicrobiales bacterium]